MKKHITKTYCDICGEEFEGHVENCKNNYQIRKFSYEKYGCGTKEIEDICFTCSEKILKFMNDLNPNENYTTVVY